MKQMTSSSNKILCPRLMDMHLSPFWFNFIFYQSLLLKIMPWRGLKPGFLSSAFGKQLTSPCSMKMHPSPFSTNSMTYWPLFTVIISCIRPKIGISFQCLQEAVDELFRQNGKQILHSFFGFETWFSPQMGWDMQKMYWAS